MPDGGQVREGAHRHAVDRVARFICSLAPDAKSLSLADLKGYRAYSPVAGWRILVTLDDGNDREFDILVDGAFPHSVPLVFVRRPPPPMTWPHVESDGRLCLLPDHYALDREDPCSLVKILIGKACQLVEAASHGDLDGDFQTEFLSYWNRLVGDAGRRIISLLNPEGPSRQVSVATHRNGWFVVAESATDLANHLQRCPIDRRVKFGRGVLAWLPDPPMPSDYPKKASDLLSLLQRQATDAWEMLRQQAADAPKHLTVILASKAPNGPCLAALTLERQPPRPPGRGNPTPSGGGSAPARPPRGSFATATLAAPSYGPPTSKGWTTPGFTDGIGTPNQSSCGKRVWRCWAAARSAALSRCGSPRWALATCFWWIPTISGPRT